MTDILTMNQITKRFGSVCAVAELSLAIAPGEILGLLGPNGSGKTTTVRLLNGVISPDQGSIEVMGYDSVRDGNAIRALSGVVTETAALYEHMSVWENLAFFAALYGVSKEDAKKQGDILLDRFGLAERRRQKAGALSTGLKKRLAIAKALIHQPRILYLDEPTAGLDPEAARDLIGYIKELNREDLTVLVCTHNLAEAEHFCNRFVFLDQGRAIESGTLGELEQKYAGAIQLRVDYRGDLAGALPADAASTPLPDTAAMASALVTVSSRQQVPGLIRALSAGVDIYRVEQVNSGLEALYFDIRRKRA